MYSLTLIGNSFIAQKKQQLFQFIFFFIIYIFISPFAQAELTVGNKDNIYTIGFAQDTMSNDWRAQQVYNVKSVLSQYSNIRFISTDANSQTAKQVLDIQVLVSQGIDLLITSPRDSKALIPVITATYKKGIPVILLERSIDSSNYTSLIGPDNLAIGQQAADVFGRHPDKIKRVFMLKGVPKATPTIQRTQGFEQALKEYPAIKIVASKVANYLRADAIHATEDVLNSGVKFDAIYAQSDSMATGARMALHKAGITPGSIPIIGIDYIQEARDAIRKGEQQTSFTYSTAGKEGGRYAIKILNGEKIPKHIIIPSVKVDINNVNKIEAIF